MEADRGAQPGVLGPQRAPVRITGGLPPGLVPVLEDGQDLGEQPFPVTALGSKARCGLALCGLARCGLARTG
jgi:hypothetical protein